MTIGTSIVLIAVGAVLRWAVTAHVRWIDLQTTGTVIFIVGLLGLVLSLIYTFWWADRAGRRDDTRVMRPPPNVP